MKVLLFISILFFSIANIAQSLRIKVSDQDNEPIPYVKVAVNSTTAAKNRTDDEGFVNIRVALYDTLSLQSMGFEKRTVLITSRILKKYVNKDRTYFIKLNTAELDVVNISAKSVDTVFGHPVYYVQDFIFLDEQFLLLAYTKSLEKDPTLLLTDANKEIQYKYEIPSVNAQYLFSDFEKSHYIVGGNGIHTINIQSNSIKLYETSEEDFYGFYNRVLDTLDDDYFYSDFNELYPAVNFYATKRNDTSHHKIAEVKDDFMMELYRAQYKYLSGRDKLWAFRKEKSTGIDKEIWAGATYFTGDILYKPVYAPFFVIEDTLNIFDHYHNYLYKYDKLYDVVDSIPINYHINKNGEKWKQPLIKDEVTDLIYTLYYKGGYTYLRRIDAHTGTPSDALKLNFRFVENVKVHDNAVYYIYRPFESIQRKFIYKERIPTRITEFTD